VETKAAVNFTEAAAANSAEAGVVGASTVAVALVVGTVDLTVAEAAKELWR
jgi:hypothetical protein